MEYSDNPRKVYGKVEIVYSDKEISSNMGITVSGNSKISHPREVFEGYVSPTVRACTMDGNSDMSGSYQMVDDTCIVAGGLAVYVAQEECSRLNHISSCRLCYARLSHGSSEAMISSINTPLTLRLNTNQTERLCIPRKSRGIVQ